MKEHFKLNNDVKIPSLGFGTWQSPDGEIEIKYNQKKNAKYSGQPDKPIESMMWKNRF